MFIRTSIAVVLAVSQFANTPETQGQRPPTFRGAMDLVTIHASVRDRQGRLITGLTPADFEIRDNGQLRQILSVRSDRESPISLAFLVDMSGSMRLSGKIGMARQAYANVLSQLRQGQDEAALFTFDEALHERRGFTRDIAGLAEGLSDFDAFGATSLYDATAAAARRLAGRPGSSKAIVVLTDGTDTSSKMTASEVSGLAASIDVPVYIVATVAPSEQRQPVESAPRAASDDADLRDLARWTGGQFVFATTFGETALAAASLVADLRHQYLLGIEAAGSGEWRRLDVRVRRPATVVKARAGYFGG
jgi:VWFA-related protein